MIPGWLLVRIWRYGDSEARRATRAATARRIVRGAIALLVAALAAWWVGRA